MRVDENVTAGYEKRLLGKRNASIYRFASKNKTNQRTKDIYVSMCGQ